VEEVLRLPQIAKRAKVMLPSVEKLWRSPHRRRPSRDSGGLSSYTIELKKVGVLTIIRIGSSRGSFR
jgi:hypothetical protein